MTADVCVEAAAALPAELGPWALLAVLGGQLVEYVFPPAPGEVTTVLGVFLAVQGGGSLGGVLVAALVGSVLGAGAAWWLGGRALRGARGESLAPLVARFERHGAAYLLVNRFLPGIRPLLFVAAGAAGMRVVPVLLYATLSALAWNTLLALVPTSSVDANSLQHCCFARLMARFAVALALFHLVMSSGSPVFAAVRRASCRRATSFATSGSHQCLFSFPGMLTPLRGIASPAARRIPAVSLSLISCALAAAPSSPPSNHVTPGAAKATKSPKTSKDAPAKARITGPSSMSTLSGSGCIRRRRR